MARCGLTERMLTLFLQALAAHENTLECIDICGNPGRLHAPYLNDMMMYFPFLRKLSLSRLLLTNGSHPLLTVEVLFRWRLESLDLRFVVPSPGFSCQVANMFNDSETHVCITHDNPFWSFLFLSWYGGWNAGANVFFFLPFS